MSQHRGDHDADRRRITDLEAQIAEREAALSTEGVALAERDAEIARLRRQLALGLRPGPVRAAQSARWVVLPIAAVAVGLAAGLLALQAPRPVIAESTQPSVLADPTPPERAALSPALQGGEAPDDVDLAALEAARKEHPGSAEANHLLGRALLLRGGHAQEARRYLELAVFIDPSLAEAHLLLGQAFEQQGDMQQALAHYRRYLELAPPGGAHAD